MRPSSRHHVNKRSSARSFKASTRRTKALNLKPGLMRGGIRL